MKKIIFHSLITCCLLSTAFMGCTQKKEIKKVTEIPVTTKSQEALNSMKQGLQYQDQGDRQQARAMFAKAVEQDPKLALAYLMYAGTSNTPQEFVQNVNKAKANLEGASNWEKWYCDYFETFMTGDWNKRLDVAKMIADSFPDAARAQADLGTVYAQGNDQAKARACYEKAIALDSAWVGGYTSMSGSWLFVEPRDFKKAEEFALKAVALAPKSQATEVLLGDCYRAENDLAKARDAYGKAIELDPSSAEAYYKKGHANTFLGNFDEARQNYTDGSSHDVIKSPANGLIAYTYLYQGDPGKAISMLLDFAAKADAAGGSASQITNDKLAYYQDCLHIAAHLGDAAGLKKGLDMTEPLLSQVGNDVGTDQAKRQQQGTILYWQSILAALQQNYGEAKAKAEEIRKTLEPVNDPNKLDQYHFALGFIAMKEKMFKEAIDHFQQSHPENNVYTQYWLANANEAEGDKDKANGMYKKLSVFNFNGIEFALIRSEVLAKTSKM